jgi:hypothetical protein
MADRAETAKLTAGSRAARSSATEYRYRFPASGRRCGGAFTVEQAGARLLSAFRLHRACVRVIAGALIRIGPIELKIELAHHLYQHAEAAATLRRRLAELRVSDRTLDEPIPGPLETAVNELLLLDDPVVFVLALERSLVDALHTALRAYAEDTDSLLDQPSLRALRQILADLDGMREWCRSLERCALQAGDSPAAWRDAAASIRRLLREEVGRRGSPVRYERPHVCVRDDRLPVFNHTRQYRDDDLPNDRRPQDDLAARVLELFRVQRDELDAIETFANVVYDMRPSFELELMLARLIWDEARHAEMGQQNLERLGFDPFAVPCGIIGINVRSPLPPLLAFAQISIFGELNQIGALRRIADRCYGAGDEASGRAFDFTHADELMHVRIGRLWLRRLAAEAGIDLQTLERQALQHAVLRLREENVVGEDYANSLTSADIAALVGE